MTTLGAVPHNLLPALLFFRFVGGLVGGLFYVPAQRLAVVAETPYL